jgi:hypothetical protein
MIGFNKLFKVAGAAKREPVSRPPRSAMVAAPTIPSDRSDALDALTVVGAVNPASPFPLLFAQIGRR